MSYRFGLLLVMAALSCACPFAYAENTADAPLKVPFSAFRMKPILDFMHADAPHTTLMAAAPVVKPAAKPKIPVPAHITPPTPVPAPSVPQKIDTRAPRTTQPAHDVSPPAPRRDVAIFMHGIPVPPSKPQIAQIAPPDAPATPPAAAPDDMVGDAGAYVPPTRIDTHVRSGSGPVSIERIPAQVVAPDMLDNAGAGNDAAHLPRPPEVSAQSGVFHPVDRSRFDRDSRTAGGLRTGSNLGHIAFGSFGGSAVHVDKLKDADGVSSVLLPGRTQTAAAPDYQNMVAQGGLPHDVVLFFQEGSTEMEAGQMDVVNSDILSVLQGKPGLKLEITGFAEDQPGGQGATDKLAMARASAIRNYLLNRSIAPGRLTVRAKGDDTGIEPRDRVEVYFSR